MGVWEGYLFPEMTSPPPLPRNLDTLVIDYLHGLWSDYDQSKMSISVFDIAKRVLVNRCDDVSFSVFHFLILPFLPFSQHKCSCAEGTISQDSIILRCRAR